MRIKPRFLTLGLSTLLLLSAGCSFNVSTANMSSLKIGKEKPVSQEVTSFNQQDTIYATAVISNNPGTVKVKGQLFVEDVPGQKAGPIPGLETSVELPSSGEANFTFSPPSNGWPKGKYKFEAIMINEAGEPKDHKSGTFSVS